MTSATQDRVRVRRAGRRHRTWRDAGRAPLGYVEGMNLYEYVGSNPANLTDPMGLCGGTAPDPYEDYDEEWKEYNNLGEDADAYDPEQDSYLATGVGDSHLFRPGSGA